jgi:carotenoid cleavage dioxygenase-like enzyme
MTNLFLQDNYAPLQKENDFDNIETIIGEIPKELNGVLYRNGPNPQFPENDKHWFEGDGMLHMFSIKNGKISYRNRWIRTERFELERRIGKAHFNSFKNPFTLGPSGEEISHGTANTNIVWHGSKLLALQENSYAIEIDPFTLNTYGKWDYNQQVPQMSAHPHFDANTGEMHNYAYHPGSNHINYYVFDPNGNVIKTEIIDGPFSCFMHDFFITKQYVLFPFLPLTFNMERAQKGKPMLMWEPEQGAHIGVMPRNGTSKNILWFKLEPFYAYHFMNAFQNGNQIVLDGMKANRTNLFPDISGKITKPTENPPQLTRWTFNLENKKATETQLDSLPAEFPRFDERFTGLHYRHGFVIASIDPNSKDAGFDSIIHYDLKTKSQTKREFGAGNIPSEPVFVPRSKNCDEGDGFLLSVVYNAARNCSDLYILDAMNINKEPIAIVQLPHRVPNGFHGNWCNNREI